MPEYLAPGVYVEEYDGDSHAIPGVATSIDDATAQALIERFKDLVPPDWTGFNESDPGITLGNLFAWLAENVLYRTGGTTDARREAAFRDLLWLQACARVVRPRYFEGQLLDAATLAAEQNYQRQMRRRHNLAVSGYGVVGGLGVQVETTGDSPRIVVDPGYAVDPLGDELALGTKATVRLAGAVRDVFVSLHGWQRLHCQIPTANGHEATRIEEVCVIAISARFLPVAVPLAHLLCTRDGWAVDASFVTPLARPAPSHRGGSNAHPR